ncbi:Oxysterol-binding protein-domain-containing protein [Phycomyces nitens]|nr:Oxysterol-binding protein-domain-containing protein [Phycomyces nitens]
MEVVQVQPRDTYLHYVHVPTKGMSIHWTFTTKRKNIAFGLYKRIHDPPHLATQPVMRLQKPNQTTTHTEFRTPSTLSSNHSLMTNSSQKTESPSDDDRSNFFDTDPSATSANPPTHRPRSKSLAKDKLKEKGELEEIIPIEHYNSSSNKTSGSFVVQEPGYYVLVFDNTFSRTTPKVLSFSVTLSDKETNDPFEDNANDIAGWILKKRRKRLQGWAKRWFQLSHAGILSYATSPTGVKRGAIQIRVATLTFNEPQRMIHIDSGTVIYHLKALDKNDFALWCTAFKRFKATEGCEGNSRGWEVPENSVDTSHGSADPVQTAITKGIESARNVQYEVENYMQNADHIKHILNRVGQIQGLEDLKPHITAFYTQLEKDKDHIQKSMRQQTTEWKNVQEAFQTFIHPSHQGSPRNRNLFSIQEGMSEVDGGSGGEYRGIYKSGSESSSTRMSTMSDMFFDAEENILSEEEDVSDSSIYSDDDDDDDDDEDDDDGIDDNGDTASKSSKKQRETIDFTRIGKCQERRKTLPSPSVGDPASAISIFRKNVGKDLSQVAMPVSMNEPISLLQKACEDLEYSELLDKAAGMNDPMDRLMYVAVFAISSYASSQYRTGRKPFNPMLTETYENIRPDKGFRFIAEKVSHHPLVIAAHADSKNYKYWQASKVKSKFWGKSMEFMTEGTFHITLTGHEDHYTYFKPSSWMRNMIAGEKYLEHVGEMKVQDHTSGAYASVTFKEGTGGGLFGAPTKRDDVVATLFDKDGKKCRRLVGKWSQSMAEEVDMNGSTFTVLWHANPPHVKDYQKYYGFTRFCVELNEITPIEDHKIPKTDSRLRPDQSLYEQGKEHWDGITSIF